MITIYLRTKDFSHDIYALVKAFYPGEEVKITEGGTSADAEICFDKGTPLAITFDTPELDASRKERKDRIKQQLYQVLSKSTEKHLPWGTLTGIRPTKIALGMLEAGSGEDEIASHMRDTYFTSQEKIDLSIEIAKTERKLLEKIDYHNGYSLYIGIPFCPTTCLYCSFTSYPASRWEKEMDRYIETLFIEMDFIAEQCQERQLHTVYIGGGTPTTLSAEQLDRLISGIKERFELDKVQEFTVEAGRPDSVSREKFEVLKKHGISRISINPQTMKEDTLKLIGRKHTVAQVKEAFRMAREEGLDNINMDLIVGLPGETYEDVKNTFEQLKELQPDSITVHSLAVKRAAALKQWEQAQAYQMENNGRIMEMAAQYAAEMGMIPYYLYRQKNMAGNFENVGYAKVDKAGIYNILIMEEKQTILAAGAGAASKFVLEKGSRIERAENVKDVGLYIDRISEMIERKRRRFNDY